MAATAPPEIRVYALFPHAVATSRDLIDVQPSNWHWVHCLTLPVETLNALQFSQRPHKWIRYAIGVIVGAEGDLSSLPDSLNVVDYNAVLPAESTALYYHTSEEKRRRMFPVDPDIGRTRITSSVATARRAHFRDNVAERDGRTCVLTSIGEAYCDAVHLLAHRKGNEVCHGILYSQSASLTIATVVVHCGLYSAPQSRPYRRRHHTRHRQRPERPSSEQLHSQKVGYRRCILNGTYRSCNIYLLGT